MFLCGVKGPKGPFFYGSFGSKRQGHRIFRIFARMANEKHGFGTWPVYLTAISSILGAILFLRLGLAVGTLGFWGTIAILLLGHLITIPTALAISELSTNTRVEGGGVYFIISRSFGLKLGATIGIALYFSQAISIAFYIVAFAESFSFLFDWWQGQFGWELPRQVISVPMLLVCAVIILRNGAGSGMKMLYFVVLVLAASLLLFYFGKPVVPVETAEARGLCTIVKRPNIPADMIAAWFKEKSRKYSLQRVAFDEFRETVVKNAFLDAGIVTEPIRRGWYTHMKIAPQLDILYGEHNIVYVPADRREPEPGETDENAGKGDFMMNWYTNNTCKEYDKKGNVSFEKIEPIRRKTDGFHAFLAAMCSDFKTPLPDGTPIRYEGIRTYVY